MSHLRRCTMLMFRNLTLDLPARLGGECGGGEGARTAACQIIAAHTLNNKYKNSQPHAV